MTALAISLLVTPLAQTVASAGALVTTTLTSNVQAVANRDTDEVITRESDSPTAEQSHSQAAEEIPAAQESDPPSSNDSVNSPYELDGIRIASLVHDKVNDHRGDHDRESLAYDNKLARIALGHSEDMADRDFFDHDNPDGLDPSERGEEVGFTCHKELGGGWYSEGIAENIAQVYVFDGTIYYVGGIPRYTWLTEEQIADDIFNAWRTSPGHNQNMLEKDYGSEGIGIAIDEDGKVYATENFC